MNRRDQHQPTLLVVLVSDVVGSTLVRTAVGEQRATELFRTLEAGAAEIVAAHGGRVVKHLGDGTMAAFASASGAVGAARALQATAGGVGAALDVPEDVRLRIGLAVGDVDELGGDLSGIPAVVAARLCDLAGPGEILAETTVVELTMGRTGVDAESRGEVELRGCPAPVRVAAVPWSPATAAVPLPDYLRRALSPTFVGRGDELASLSDAYRDAVDGGGVVVVSVTGEAGLGKTSLLARFAAGVREDGAEVIGGTCREGPQPPFEAWGEAIGALLAALPLADAAAASAGDLEVLARLAPRAAERWGIEVGPDTADGPDRLFDAVADLLSRRATQRPVVVILDDLHWASDDFGHMLRRVLERVEGRVLFVLAHRGTDVGPGHAAVTVLQDVTRIVGVRPLPLGGLSLGDLRDLMWALGVDDTSVSEEQLADAERRGGGNPLLSRELLRHGSDGGPVVTAAEAVRRRLGRLPSGTRHVLGVAAVLGGEFSVTLLGRCVPEMAEHELLDELEVAHRAGLVDDVDGDPDRQRFVHGLVPEVLMADLSAARRGRLHLRAAEAHGEQGDAAVLAHHYVSSRMPVALEPAVRFSRIAARAEARALAYEHATATLRRALGLVEDLAPERRDLTGWVHVEIAANRYLAGDIDGRRDHAAVAGEIGRERGDVALLQQAAINRAGFPQPDHPDPVAVELLDAAIAATPADEVGLKAELLSILAYYRGINEGRRAEADSLARIAIDTARAGGSPRDLAEALAARSFLLTAAPGVEEHRALCDELETLAATLESEADRERHLQYVHRQRGPLWLRAGDLPRFTAELEALDRFGRERRSWLAAATCSMWRGMLAHGRGAFGDAQQHYDDMAVIAEGQANFSESYSFALFVIRRSEGRLAELADIARELVSASEGFRAFEPALAVIELAVGEEDDAERLWSAWRRDDFARLPEDVTGSGLLPLLAELCVRFGSPADAGELRTRLDRYGGELLVAAWGVCSLGAADRFRAMLARQQGDDAAAGALFEAASTLEEAVGFTAQAAETRRVAGGVVA